MTDKLREAAERIVAAYHEINRLLLLAGGIPQPIEASTDKAVILACAYLAEHPSDDGELITEEYLRSLGFENVVSSVARAISLPNSGVDCVLSWGGGIEPMTICVRGWTRPHIKTRGQVRRLLDALGVAHA